MVLGHSIRQTGSTHDLVVLHTDEVCDAALELLRTCGWILKKVEHVRAAESLFQEGCLQMRFANVFTKLHVFGLTDYSKVVMMDSDILVRRNIDDLFDLEAPAAMARGALAGYKHGEPIDGRSFFSDANAGVWAWGQGTGINAGVMLFEPSEETLAQCLREVGDEKHPEHLRGNGPEQDYLSRYFADRWTHIDVGYNFQLHQMYYALNPSLPAADRRSYLADGDGIKAFHYSSDPKPWARYTSAVYAALEDKQWFNDFKMTFTGHRVWICKEPLDLESEARKSSGKLAVGSDGKLHKVIWDYPEGSSENPEPIFETTDYGVKLGPVVEADPKLCEQVEAVTNKAILEWEEAYRSLEHSLGEKDLASRVMSCGKESAEKKKGSSEWSGWGSADANKEKWAPVNGWWVERPLGQRLSVFGGTLPSPFATIAVDDRVIYHSSQASNLFLLSEVSLSTALRPPFELCLPISGSVKGALQACDGWLKALPNDAFIALAAVLTEQTPEITAFLNLLLKTLAANDVGSPSELPTFAAASPAASVGGDSGFDPSSEGPAKEEATPNCTSTSSKPEGSDPSNGMVVNGVAESSAAVSPGAPAQQDEASSLLVFVACGRRGQEWSQTHAAPTVALATTRIAPKTSS
mmetsp:Transcript_45716/g.97999  ORF Transcript_45716/g.97999 Transcript_45716/m.97999 type:complete len:636 (+) Transcript_45716:576-2483(+)